MRRRPPDRHGSTRNFVQDLIGILSSPAFRTVPDAGLLAARRQEGGWRMDHIRDCVGDDFPTILAIINAAAEAYRGVIPPDRWHEPYMPPDELHGEIAAGVLFSGYAADGALRGVMGVQRVRDVDLIRHAYVLPEGQRRGVGSALLRHLRRQSKRRMLVGTWAAATWAVGFYQRHGFVLVTPAAKTTLLKTYWTIPERQIETSVVLADPPLDDV
jgi:GNAT superfamily N-acetyltransferase